MTPAAGAVALGPRESATVPSPVGGAIIFKAEAGEQRFRLGRTGPRRNVPVHPNKLHHMTFLTADMDRLIALDIEIGPHTVLHPVEVRRRCRAASRSSSAAASTTSR
ncbi:MAG TPA: hypothetical protein VK904_08085 [Miltoncostaeaceae bacterium]|nr:hypothetical protein [Miltoncostaeaceae bacterium]